MATLGLANHATLLSEENVNQLVLVEWEGLVEQNGVATLGGMAVIVLSAVFAVGIATIVVVIETLGQPHQRLATRP